MTIFLIYFLGLFLSFNFVITCFYSNILAHFTDFFFKPSGEEKLYTREDFESYIFFNWKPWIVELFCCKICFSHWVSFFVGVILFMFCGVWWIVFATTFSYPAIIFVLDKNLIEKGNH